MDDFVWHDGERTIRFGSNALEHVWIGAELLTTERAQPGFAGRFAAVHHVASGGVPDAAAALVGAVSGTRFVAWGGGRVVDVAKAVASAHGGEVCAVPTTLSGAEMSSRHRSIPGYEDRALVRPSLVLADPVLMTSAPDPMLRASAMNALGHAAEALWVPGRNPVATMAALRAAAGISAALDGRGAPSDLALASILAGYALGSTGLSLHHVLCQTVVRMCGTPHAATNAVMLPFTVEAISKFAPGPMAELAAALDTDPDGLAQRITILAGAPGTLAGLGVERDALDSVAEAASARSELRQLHPPPTRAQLLRLLERAW